MSNYAYEAVDAGGRRIRGALDVLDQSKALKRIQEMGLFPTKIAATPAPRIKRPFTVNPPIKRVLSVSSPVLGGRIKPAHLVGFIRQLATLIEAGRPLLRGLRIHRELGGHRGTNRRVAGNVDEGCR